VVSASFVDESFSIRLLTTRGLLRHYFPKKTNFPKASQLDISEAVWLLNHWLSRYLGDRTPH
jgi:IS30 family transposase